MEIVDENPNEQWRGAPFWALNGELEPDELRRQIRGFKEKGLGGFFLHARTGLRTAYLSPRWFECMAAAIDEAEKQGLKAWLYDEDRYPSGSGGGFITKNPAWRAKGIFIDRQDVPEKAVLPGTVVALFAAKMEGDKCWQYREVKATSECAAGESLLVFYTDTICCSPWYNSYTYMDTLCKEAVADFIHITHDQYKAHFQDKFGKVIPGIFTDEPRYGFVIHQPEWDDEKRMALPWTPGFLEEFKATYGYALETRLPELFYNVAGVDSVAPRYQYIETLMLFFLSSFAGQISSWCKDNHLLLTGHVVAEDSLSYQTLCVGSAMRFYEYMGMPGMDLLTEHHRAYQTAKQVSSAARQFGQRRRLTETYGCTGWDFPIAGFRALGDWQFALGINFRCQHLAFYTMEGEAKRDYPAPVANHSNTPENYRLMEDYFSRLSQQLSQGSEKRDILVISAIESAWTKICINWRKAEDTLEYDRDFTEVLHTLLAHQLDFDLGDEDILARHAHVEKGDVPVLHVGHASYLAIVVPQLITIRSSTLKLLNDFKAAGGTVLTLKSKPTHVDGYASDTIEWPFRNFANPAELVPYLEPFRILGISSPCPALLYQFRNCADYDVLFVCNTGRPVDEGRDDGCTYTDLFVLERKVTYPDVTLKISSDKNAFILEYNPDTGEFASPEASYDGKAWNIHTSFSQLISRMFMLCGKNAPFHKTPGAVPRAPLCQIPSDGEIITVNPEQWNIRLLEENVGVLDHFSSAIHPESTFVLALDDQLRKEAQVSSRSDLMPQPWCRKIDDSKQMKATIRAQFNCEYVPEGPLYLVIERPELYTLRINGEVLPLQDVGSWHEKAWRKCLLPADCLVPGLNCLELTTIIRERHPGLENVYILGDFGVREELPSFTLTPPPHCLKIGDWCQQGLPFYAGDVCYEAEVTLPHSGNGRIILPAYEGTPAIVSIEDLENGKNSSVAQPMLYTSACSECLYLPQHFRLKISITGSMRNACGPFFQKEVRPTWVGPYNLRSIEQPKRLLASVGLMAPVLIRYEES